MAQTYEQWKKSYESLDDAQKKQYADAISGKGADYIGNKYLSQYNSASTTSTPKNTSSNTVTETYRGEVSDGTSGMNSMSQSKAQDNSRNFQVGTGDVVDTPKQQTPSLNQTSYDQQFATSWNSLSAAQQQAALTKKGMLDYVNSKGLTIKKEEPATTTTPTTTKKTTPQTPKQAEWDYQDNSQARMNEILNNLNGYRQTNPELFKDASAFYTFFIDGKGRSQDQIDYLWDYYNNVQKYGKYDNMPASSLGDGLANGSIPKDYLDYLKSTDPAKYQEVLSYKQDSEDRIKNENYLDDLSSLAGYESEESEMNTYPDEVTYAKSVGYLVDADGNFVDDRLYLEPTDEERQDVDRINEINARRMEIKNMQKNLLDDLVEQYPGVPKATLMGIVQDRTKDISREYDDLGVELVQLQGTVDYLQNERKMQTDAGQSTIDNLQKAYGMYYNYSPAGIISRTRAQYEASNITLDQADSGTETEKQMALQNVLDGYYEKYGSIIQRSEQQVINDVIAYAKKKGIGLAQALQENFVQPLQQKPGFAQLNASQSNPYVVKVGDVAYRYNPATDEFELITGTAGISGGGASGTYQFTDAEVRTGDTIGNDINSIGHILASDDGLRVGTYKSTNGYTYNVYANRDDGIKATENLLRKNYYGLSLEDAAQKWIGKGKDISAAKKVIQNGGLSLGETLSDSNVKKFIEAMGKREGTLKNGQSLDDWAKGGKDLSGYGGQTQGDTQRLNAKFGNDRGWNNNGYFDSLTEEYKQYLSNGKTAITDKQWEALKNDYGIDENTFRMMAQNYARTGMKAEEVSSAANALESAIKLYEYINGDKSEWAGRQNSAQAGPRDRLMSWRGVSGTKANDARGYYDTLLSRLTLDKLIETKKQGATYGAMSEGEWKLLGNAATDLNWTSSGSKFQENLEDLIYSLYRVVEEGEGGLPINFTDSSAAKMLYKGENSGRRNAYKEDNAPVDYDNFGTRPSRIS